MMKLGVKGTISAAVGFGLLLSLLALAIIGVVNTWGGGTWYPPIPTWLPALVVVVATLAIIVPALLCTIKRKCQSE